MLTTLYNTVNYRCIYLHISFLFLPLLQAAPQSVLSLMPYVMPVLEERLSWAVAVGAVTAAAGGGPTTSTGGKSGGASGGRCTQEPSEEIRHKLTSQLLVVLKLASKAMSAYAAEVVQVK